MSDATTPPGSGQPSATSATSAGKADATATPDKGATSASSDAAQRKIRLALDGDKEEEFDIETIRSWRQNDAKGRNAAQLATRMDQKHRAAEEKLARLEETKGRAKTKGERLKLMREFYGYSDSDLRDLAEEILLPEIQRETLTAEQRAVYEAQQRAEEAERRLKDREEGDKKSELERLAREHQARIGQICVAALDKVGIPKESAPWALKRMAALLDKVEDIRETTDPNFELSPDDIASLVREDLLNEHRGFTTSMSPAQAESLFGKEFVDKLVKYRVEQHKERQRTGQRPAPGVARPQAPSTNGKPRTTMNENEFDAYVKQLVKEG